MIGKDSRCRATVDDVPCSAPGAYRATLADCRACAAVGFLGCFGHPVCVHDAAALRAGGLFFLGHHDPLVVTHVRNLQTTVEVV